MSQPFNGLYKFGSYRLDRAKRQLTRGDENVTLAPKTFDLLVLLLESNGRVLTKRELMESLWPDAFVEETSLSYQVATLRKALAEEGSEWIETVPKHGFRFTMTVTMSEEPDSCTSGLLMQVFPEGKHESRGPMSRRIDRHGALEHMPWAAATALAIALCVALLGWWRAMWPIQQKPAFVNSLAVLPFINASGDPGHQYLSQGITESLITGLSHVSGIKVKSGDTTFRYKGQDKDVQVIGHELSVRSVLKGRLTQRGDSLQIIAELIDTKDGTLLWREEYDRRLEYMVEMEQQISKEVSNHLPLKIDKQSPVGFATTQNPAAYQLYLKGRFYLSRRTEQPLKQAVEYFQQAIQVDPIYARAWAGLADSYVLLGNYSLMPAADSFPRAVAAARKAVELDDKLAEAHVSLGWLKTTYEWDWPGAEKEFQHALALDPEYGAAHHWYAFYLVTVGRMSDAIREIRRAREMDPLSPIIGGQVGAVYFYARDYAQAIKESQRAVELDPDFYIGYNVLGMTYAVLGKQKEAMAQIESALRLSGRDPNIVAQAGCAFGFLGQRESAQKLLDELIERSRKQHVASLDMAIIYASLRDSDRAMRHFKKESPIVPFWLRNPLIDAIRSDPRFQDMFLHMGLRDIFVQ